jgi:hypothetical protein
MVMRMLPLKQLRWKIIMQTTENIQQLLKQHLLTHRTKPLNIHEGNVN